MRTRRNIAQEYHELALRNPKKSEATLEDGLINDWANDPVYLARELNLELSEMRDEVNHSLAQIKVILISHRHYFGSSPHF
jgi:hypothetical protein